MTHPTPPAESPHADEWLEAALRDAAAGHAAASIHDDGFTAKVIAALPVGAETSPAWRKPAVGVMWGAAGLGACVALPQLAIDVGREAFALLSTQPVSVSQIGMALLFCGVATWSATAYVLRND